MKRIIAFLIAAVLLVSLAGCASIFVKPTPEPSPEPTQAPAPTAKPTEARVAGDGPRQPKRVKPGQKVGRNDPCPCGSGKKYKNCCGRAADD